MNRNFCTWASFEMRRKPRFHHAKHFSYKVQPWVFLPDNGYHYTPTIATTDHDNRPCYHIAFYSLSEHTSIVRNGIFKTVNRSSLQHQERRCDRDVKKTESRYGQHYTQVINKLTCTDIEIIAHKTLSHATLIPKDVQYT